MCFFSVCCIPFFLSFHLFIFLFLFQWILFCIQVNWLRTGFEMAWSFLTIKVELDLRQNTLNLPTSLIETDHCRGAFHVTNAYIFIIGIRESIRDPWVRCSRYRCNRAGAAELILTIESTTTSAASVYPQDRAGCAFTNRDPTAGQGHRWTPSCESNSMPIFQ